MCRHVKTYNNQVENGKEDREPEPTNDLLSSFIGLDINGKEIVTKTEGRVGKNIDCHHNDQDRYFYDCKKFSACN